MKCILVTGGAGFVGSHLCHLLIEQGNKVLCVDNLYTGRLKNIEDLKSNQNFKFLHHDIIQPLTLAKIRDEIGCELDEIYNLACPASPPAYQKDPIFTLKTSVWGTLNMLELAKQTGAKMLQASTSEVYGDPTVHPQPESYWGNVNPIGIRSNYDEGKRAAETLCMDYWRTYGVKIKIVRIFNTYGPHMDPADGRVVSNFIVQALVNRNLTVYGDGSQTRSFQFVSDLIEGMLRTMATDDDFTGPVNLGNPGEFTMLELAEKVLSLIPESQSRIEFQPLPSDDPKVRRPDISLAKAKLGWEPTVNLDQGLVQTIDYFRSEIQG
jgi:UDP-glucuronate decarboxylase